MAADMRAETGPGASGWARGSHTCSGTAPAFEPNPTTASTNAVERTQGARCGPWAAITAKDWLPARSASNTSRQEQHRRPELGHHRVPLARPLHLVADAVVGQDQAAATSPPSAPRGTRRCRRPTRRARAAGS